MILSAIIDKLASEYIFIGAFFIVVFTGSTLATTFIQELVFCHFKQILQLSLEGKILFQIKFCVSIQVLLSGL
jgi:hypothetical protein